MIWLCSLVIALWFLQDPSNYSWHSLPNGAAVYFVQDNLANEVSLSFYYRGGIMSEAAETKGISRLVAHTLANQWNQATQHSGLLIAEIQEEFVAFHTVCQPAELSTLSGQLAEFFWQQAIQDPAPKISWQIGRQWTLLEFVRSKLLQRSPYREGIWQGAVPDYPLMTLEKYKKDYLTPSNCLLVVRGIDVPKDFLFELNHLLEKYPREGYATSFLVVEEFPYSKQQQFLLWHEQDYVLISTVFAAPGRGSADIVAWVPIWETFYQEITDHRVWWWEGVGAGLFFVERKCEMTDFQEVLSQHREQIQTLSKKISNAREGNVAQMQAGNESVNVESLVLNYFWGAGFHAARGEARHLSPQAKQRTRALARIHLSRPYLFVLWPAAAKDDFPGFSH